MCIRDRDKDGMKKLFKRFSFPGGIPSHVAPETPGSIHELSLIHISLVNCRLTGFQLWALVLPGVFC